MPAIEYGNSVCRLLIVESTKVDVLPVVIYTWIRICRNYARVGRMVGATSGEWTQSPELQRKEFG